MSRSRKGVHLGLKTSEGFLCLAGIVFLHFSVLRFFFLCFTSLVSVFGFDPAKANNWGMKSLYVVVTFNKHLNIFIIKQYNNPNENAYTPAFAVVWRALIKILCSNDV